MVRLFFCLALCIFAPAALAAKLTTDELRIIKGFAFVEPLPDRTNKYHSSIQAKQLGKKIFFDTRLSGDGQFSCASCHDFAKSLADGLAMPRGAGTGVRNTPTLINVALNRWFFWDGRADSLWSQAIQPIESPVEMAGDWSKIYQLFNEDPWYRKTYSEVFAEYPLQAELSVNDPEFLRFKANIGKAIAAFEVDLLQFNSRFDRYLNRVLQTDKDNNELTRDEKNGLKIFIGKGNCIACHFGPNFSDGEFHSVRLLSSVTNPNDSGRFAGIKALMRDPLNSKSRYSDMPAISKVDFLKEDSSQWAAFKTPTLRNVEHTAPYMHDASLPTLRSVIEHYATFDGAAPKHHKNAGLLLPFELSEREKDQLIAFLKTLSGSVDIPSYY